MNALQYQISFTDQASSNFSNVIEHVNEISNKWSSCTTKAEQLKMGQVFTSSAMSQQLCSLLPHSYVTTDENTLIADPEAGTGALSTMLASHIYSDKPQALNVLGFETDKRLYDDWDATWKLFQESASHNIDATLLEDFTSEANTLLAGGLLEGFKRPDYVVTNPPYKKLLKNSELGKVFTKHDLPISNYYSAFLALAVSWLEDNGKLLAIIPLSFCSSDYFKKFRQWLLKRCNINHIALYHSRSCFNNVLWENILLYATKKTPGTSDNTEVRLTVSNDPLSTPDYELMLSYNDIIKVDGFLLPRTPDDIALINTNRKRTHTFADLGLSMSTGKVELHRLKDGDNTKIIYPKDFANASFVWNETTKPRYVTADKKQLLELPENGDGFVLLKRISSNDGDNPRRIHPVWLSRETVSEASIAIDNHVQYIHSNNKAMSKAKGYELMKFLQSDEANAMMVACCGTTQLNKSDLFKLKLPKL
ncbi:N-6 DNA methylase [Photobacterium leiognathi]|uniref:Eco57I restriction-modification methylase domain-containing protein n=1 Tax=Photobacterium leiognathi TaxID=553611 RepID=UPI001EDDF3F9|nr:N-6 DNA methylase [Photobacterium leiognathi]MCG3883237.1 N-6 DNA methylase [Photobacterium leiognathi]